MAPHTLGQPAKTARQIGTGTALLGVAVVTGLGLRLAPILASDFPLRDGGLFVTMASDIRHASLGLPLFSSFNAGNVPFAYPPLGIYLLALTPGDPIFTERWLPLVWSILAIPAAYLLAREITDEPRAGLAALIFAAMPVTWAIEGGGVTRALALMLLLLALWRLAVLLRAPGFRNAALAGALAGLAVLAHPAVGPPGLASTAVLFASAPSRRALAFTGLAAAVAALLVAPWIAMVVIRYGLGALVAGGNAHHTDETLGRLLTIGPSWIGALDFVLPLALLGLALVLHRRQWLLPVWLLLLIAVPGGEARHAAILWAMLAASGAVTITEAVRPAGALRATAAIGFAWLFVGSLLAGYVQFHAISAAIRTEMARAGRETVPGARFAVVVDDSRLEAMVLDWFPTISGRISVGTYQGLEWTSVEQSDATVAVNDQIQRGQIPKGTDYVFRISEGSASWEPAR
ncbi:MAG: glycosyltransferase family 39 protein [Chloroflexota bacterium]